MLPSSQSFENARRVSDGEVRQSLWSTFARLDEQWLGSEAIAKDLREEIKRSKRELEEIKQATSDASREIQRLSQELREVREEVRLVVSPVTLLNPSDLDHPDDGRMRATYEHHRVHNPCM